jgi:Putative adhesin
MDINGGIRRTAIVVLSVAAAVTVAACDPAIIGANHVDANHFSDTSTITQSINRVNVDDEAGTVTITVGAGPTTVHRDVRYRNARPDQTTTVAGHALDLASCGDNCVVDYRIQVPAGTSVAGSLASGDLTLTGVADVDVHANSGDVRVSRATGSVRAATESGNVEISGANGNVTATTDSGNIDATGLAGGRASAQSESGDVRLTTNAAQDVAARSQSGAIFLTMAKGTYRVITSTESGNVDVATPNDPSGGHTLQASTESGDVRIQTR